MDYVDIKQEDGKQTLIHAVDRADVEAVMRQCEIDRQNAPGKFEKKGEFRLKARVPLHVMLELKNKYGLDFLNPEHGIAIKKILDGPEYSKFRST